MQPKINKYIYLKKFFFEHRENSLVVQWLGLRVSTAGSPGLVTGRGTKIPQAAQCG